MGGGFVRCGSNESLYSRRNHFKLHFERRVYRNLDIVSKSIRNRTSLLGSLCEFCKFLLIKARNSSRNIEIHFCYLPAVSHFVKSRRGAYVQSSGWCPISRQCGRKSHCKAARVGRGQEFLGACFPGRLVGSRRPGYRKFWKSTRRYVHSPITIHQVTLPNYVSLSLSCHDNGERTLAY